VLVTAVTCAPRALAICTAKRADAATRARDHHPLSRLHLRFVAQTLQRGSSGDPHCGGLLERQGLRLQHQGALSRDRVLGEGRRRSAEHIIARCELRDARANGLHCPGDVHAPDRLVRLPHHGRRDLEHFPAVDAVPIERVHRRGANPHQNVAVGDDRLVDLTNVQNIG